ncbi:hypothetical protein RchiOBHm_Chr5g0014561 [Rosa chinensis]|uniref:Uncharacterized protein n=1 Tax=Rosa chinensis TaxID=74649 RepID=A0A2P6Q5P4_ROSCH|nr:troponin T, slow skeletal muscle [Rosa chinensis]PRQ29501.1 hypothetical protein RchiOBHm_Chr5g0014561 [Rosa chinensis]
MEKTQQEQNLGQEEDEEEEKEEEPSQQEEPEPEVEEAAPPSDEQPPSTQIDDPPVPAPPFDPSRMIGIIRRKSLIKELAAMYHAECLSYCQELLELQRKGDEPLIDLKLPEDLKKDAMRPPKRLKKNARH